MSLTEREQRIAGFFWTAGCFNVSMEKAIKQAEEAEAKGEFSDTEIQVKYESK